MGKSRKGRQHVNKSSYPYRTSHVGQHVHVVRPRARRQGNSQQPYFIGLFAGRHQEHYTTGPKLHKQPPLKRLSFMRAYSVYLSAKIATLYSNSRDTLPGSWQQRVRLLEDRVASVGTPLWVNVHSTSDRILWQLDSKVDGLCEVADSWLHPSGALTLQTAAADGKPDDIEAFRQRIIDAFAALADSPSVHKLLDGMEPSREYLAARYQEAHHAVVASQAYNSLMRTLAGLAGRMQHSQLASAVAHRLYALVSPVADPTLDRITASPMYKDLVEHLKPVEVEACSPQQAQRAPSLALPSCAAI